MIPTETAAKLRQYNQWRRGNLEGMPQPDPREIGEAIDAAVEMIDHLDALRAELKAAHAMALIGVEWRELAEAREAELERMRRQEPIGWFARLDGDGLLMECKHADISRVPLYALPGAQAQPAPSVPECPYPCGWQNLLKHAIEDGAYLARSLNEDEPVTENARVVAMRMVLRLRDVLMTINKAAPEAKS